ncbi:MAG: O-antigen ligase family protein [Acidobacteria bacterium]|jgi:O-antigen ligase|nr:O-antigen ligase family protein [Acidobacteriota bacterium]
MTNPHPWYQRGWGLYAVAGASLGCLIASFLLFPPDRVLLALAAVVVGAWTLVVLIASPIGFLAFTMGLYGSMQVFLLEQQVLAVGSYEINASKLFVLAVTSLLLFRLLIEIARYGRLPRPTASIVLAALLAVWAGQALFRSPNPGEGTAVVARMAACSVAFFYAYAFTRTRRDFWLLWLGSALTTIAASGVALVEVLRGRANELVAIGEFRGAGGFGGAVATGTVAFFGMALAVAVLQSFHLSRNGRLLALITAVAGALGIVVTFTRTAIAGTVFFLAFFLLSSRGSLRELSVTRRLVVAALVLGAIGASFQFVSTETMLSRVSDLPGQGGSVALQSESGSGRGLIWSSLVRLQSRASAFEWVFGHGMLAVPTDLARVIRITVDGHNSVLDILYDTGLIGLAIYVALGLALLRELRAKADLSGEVAGLAAIWWCYIAAYYMSTEMFNGFVYMVGSRWYSLIIAGAILALPARPGKDGTAVS